MILPAWRSNNFKPGFEVAVVEVVEVVVVLVEVVVDHLVILGKH